MNHIFVYSNFKEYFHVQSFPSYFPLILEILNMRSA